MTAVLVRVAVGRHQPVLVFGDDDVGAASRWGSGSGSPAGSAPADDAGDLAALVTPRGPPERVATAPVIGWRATEALRASVRDSVAPSAREPAGAGAGPGRRRRRGDAAEALVEDFRTTGLTHLTAVSGTNLTLVVGFLLVVARWVGVRGRWLGVVGARGDRRLRAAGSHRAQRAAGRRDGHRRPGRPRARRLAPRRARPRRGRRRAAARRSRAGDSRPASRCRCWRPPGSCWWRRRGGTRWRGGCRAGWPRRSPCRRRPSCACTPLVAAISGQVSLVAVVANLVVAPVVGPATVLGLLGGVVGAGLGRRSAGWSARWRPGAWPGSSPSPSTAPPCPARRWTGGPRRGRSRCWSALTAALVLAGPSCCGAAPSGAAACLRARGGHGGRAADAGLAAARLGVRGLRRRSGRRAGAARGRRHGGRRRRRARPACRRPVPAPARCATGCRCSCSPTSTPTTSTGSPACSTTARWATSR